MSTDSLIVPFSGGRSYFSSPSNKENKVELTLDSFKDQVIKGIMASIFISPGSFTLGEASCHHVRSQELYGNVQEAKNWVLQPTTTWVWHLESEISSHSQAFRWLQPPATFWLQAHEKSSARTILLSCSWKTDPQILWTIINVCWFRLLHSGLICHTTVDN